MPSHGSGETAVKCEQVTVQLLRQGHVTGVEGRKVGSELEDTRQVRLVSVALQWQVEIVANGIRGAPCGESALEKGAAQGGGNFDVAQSWRMEIVFAGFDQGPDLSRAVRLQEVFDQCRGVGNDDRQEASLASRSFLIRSAAGSPRLTRPRLAIRSKTSLGIGRATSRSRIPSMYSVKDSPLARARRVNSR